MNDEQAKELTQAINRLVLCVNAQVEATEQQSAATNRLAKAIEDRTKAMGKGGAPITSG